MYLDFYQLREHPFGEAPDPRFLYFTPSHREALASIFYAIETGRGFSALIAAPGMGKTTLLNRLREAARENVRTVFFFQIDRTSRHLYESLMKELGIPATHDDAQGLITEALNHNARRGERLVLIIDEAQNLEIPVLESVRLLSNIETPTAKLLHIVLAGQPQLADTLMKQELAQLRQRISTFCRLSTLSHAETGEYLAHRLRVAGHKGDVVFSPGAVEMIAASSRGIPRNVNSLAANALSLGFVKRQALIDASTMSEVIGDLSLRDFKTGWDLTVHDVDGVREVFEVESAPCIPVQKPPAPGEAPALTRVSEPQAGSEGRPRTANRLPSVPVQLRLGQPAKGSERHRKSFIWTAAVIVAAGIALGGYYAFHRNQLVLMNLRQRYASRSQPAVAANSPARVASPPAAPKTPPAPATPQNQAVIQPAKEVTDGRANARNAIRTLKSVEQPQKLSTILTPGKARAIPKGPEPENPPAAVATVEAPPPAAASVGKLLVTSNVPGATIMLDGRSEPDWITPHTFTDLQVGSYEVALFRQGYRQARHIANVAAGKLMIVDATLVVPSGALVISTNPPGADVSIDGRPYGSSPVRANVDAGQHSFSARLAGRETVSGNVTVGDQTVVTKGLDLPPALATPPEMNVEVTTHPPKATVYVGGSPKGTTPLSFHIAPGRHTLIIFLSGFRPVRREIEVPEKGVATVKETLVAP
jgi:general secretion pathway protein A